MNTVHFRPMRRQMNAAGNASTMPISETHVMSMPNPAPVIMKLSAGLTGVAMKYVGMDTSLNCPSGAAKLTR